VRQNIANAEVTGSFHLKDKTLLTRTWVQATDTNHNLFVTTIEFTGDKELYASVRVSVGHENSNPVVVSSTGDVLHMDVKADKAFRLIIWSFPRITRKYCWTGWLMQRLMLRETVMQVFIMKLIPGLCLAEQPSAGGIGAGMTIRIEIAS